MFGPVLGESMVERLLPPLRELMAVLGRTRDYDVILAEIVGPVAAALPDDPRLSAMAGKLTDRRFASHQETTRFLARADYGRFLLAAAGELHAAGGGTTDCGPDTVAEFARKRLRRLQGRIRQLADLVRVEDPATLHALRIAIKRLRYALEFFGPLLPRRSYADTARQLAGLQDTLGQLNDLANAGAVLMGSAGHDPSLREAVALIGGWHGRRHAALLLGVPQGLASLRELRLPKFRKD
jgi:adenylate cyclase